MNSAFENRVGFSLGSEGLPAILNGVIIEGVSAELVPEEPVTYTALIPLVMN